MKKKKGALFALESTGEKSKDSMRMVVLVWLLSIFTLPVFDVIYYWIDPEGADAWNGAEGGVEGAVLRSFLVFIPTFVLSLLGGFVVRNEIMGKPSKKGALRLALVFSTVLNIMLFVSNVFFAI